MFYTIINWLFPPKCVFCRSLLAPQETDSCHSCRQNAPEFPGAKIHFSFLAQWTAVWYYKDTVRKSILRFKFYNQRSYAQTYGRCLAMKLHKENMDTFDILTWVPVSWQRRLTRGYDQVELLANATAQELQTAAVPTLKKIRHTPPQSGFRTASRRRANVLGSYRAIDPAQIQGKHILLLDDIITTGATASECARTLLTAGAKQVSFAAIAVASHEKHQKKCR